MAFAYSRQPRAYLNNTVTLQAFLYTEEDEELLIPQSDISGVTFTIVKPSDVPSTPAVQDDPGVVIDDGKAQYVVDASVNNESGNYKALATFVYTEAGNILTKSVPVEYDIHDMFEDSGATPAAPSLDLAWRRFEDCFDSDNGGPWLRDMTLAHFDKDKLKVFIPDVLMEINNQMPQTGYTEATYPFANDGVPLFAYGLFMAGVRHLMTSYVEQPTPVNAQVAYHSREEYHRRWGEIYNIELARWTRMLAMFKARDYDLSHGSILIGMKAGRMLPGNFRSRNIGRGLY